MAKMRTVDMAWEEIKTADPNTSLTKYSLRQILMSGKSRVVGWNTIKKLLENQGYNISGGRYKNKQYYIITSY
jgi:hypothetical protein